MTSDDFELLLGEFKRRLDYDPVSGQVTWRESPHPRHKVGSAVGYSRRRGYRAVEMSGKAYALHNVIWAIMTEMPVPVGMVVDHVNGDASDNRWVNLRLATPTQNNANTALRKGKLLPKGVSAHTKRGVVVSYRAFATAHGKTHYLGLFPTPEAAHAAYVKAADALFGEFARAS